MALIATAERPSDTRATIRPAANNRSVAWRSPVRSLGVFVNAMWRSSRKILPSTASDGRISGAEVVVVARPEVQQHRLDVASLDPGAEAPPQSTDAPYIAA